VACGGNRSEPPLPQAAWPAQGEDMSTGRAGSRSVRGALNVVVCTLPPGMYRSGELSRDP
jgi:hypothetical protein